MADLKELSNEMAKLGNQIETVLYISQYRDFDDLSGLSDYEEIKTADERQRLEEYRNILGKLEEIHADLTYMDRPIREVSYLHRNAGGRYETKNGYYYTCGSIIEFLRYKECYNYDTDEWEKAEIWTTSSVESADRGYYIVGYPDLEMEGLKVRVRER